MNTIFPTSGSMALPDLFHHLQERGPLALIGGHYSWPGRPSSFAIDSAKAIVQDISMNGFQKPSSFIFLNDIGATDACLPGGTCPIIRSEQKDSILTPAIRRWASRVFPAFEAMILRGPAGRTDSLHFMATELRSLSEGSFGDKILLNRLCDISAHSPMNFESWLMDLEQLVYGAAKTLFRPFLLGLTTGCALPEVIFERAMNNGASRLLHDVRKKCKQTGLEVDKGPDGVDRYLARTTSGQVIELRTEQHGLNGFKASNKCPALLAYLYYYICKKLAKIHGEREHVSVFYIVPCFDRGRLAEGIQAFLQIFNDIQDWFPFSRVTLGCGFYADASCKRMLCDIVSKQGCQLPISRTVEISTDHVTPTVPMVCVQ